MTSPEQIKLLNPFNPNYDKFMIVLHHNKSDINSDLAEIFFTAAVTVITCNFYITETQNNSYVAIYRNGIEIKKYLGDILYSSLLDWITIIECKNKFC